MLKLYCDRDWAGAEREFRRAIDLNPNYANVHHWYAEFLSLVGRHKEAIAEAERARELDPLSNIINAWVSSRYFFARQYDRAVEEGRNAVEMDPGFAPAHMVLGQAYEQKNMLSEAIREFERAAGVAEASMYEASLAHAYAAAGQHEKAREIVTHLEKTAEREFVCAYDLAVAQLALGNKARVFELLGAAYGNGHPGWHFCGWIPASIGCARMPGFGRPFSLLGLPLLS